MYIPHAAPFNAEYFNDTVSLLKTKGSCEVPMV